MQHLDKIMDLVGAELEAVVKNGKFRSREEIESVGELIDIVKDIECIWEYEDGGEYTDYSGNYANRGYSRNDRSYRGGEYQDGSYARGRNARRDSMGRYSRNYGGRSYGYAMADGKDEYVEHLREMMNNAPDEKTRMSIQKTLREIEAD